MNFNQRPLSTPCFVLAMYFCAYVAIDVIKGYMPTGDIFIMGAFAYVGVWCYRSGR